MTTTREVQRYLQSCDLSRATRPDAARSMGISQNAMAKRLRKEGASFSELLEHERRWRCVGGLSKNRHMEGDQLARKCGYTHRESFYRAFRQWYGVTLTQWRATRGVC